MRHRSILCFALGGLLLLAATSPSARANPPREKRVWNYDGGLLFATDGSIKNGPCFRLNGRLSSDDFFDNLRRVDSTSGTLFRRGNDVITEFPDQMHLSVVLTDRPCSDSLQQTGTRIYLTKAIIASMRVSFAWKRGMELRPAREITLKNAEAHLIPPYAQELAAELPDRYEWSFDFSVPSKGVPLMDSLVIVFTAPNGHIIARVAARM